MRPFDYQRADGLEHAAQLSEAQDAAVIAGGTNLIDLMKLQVEITADACRCKPTATRPYCGRGRGSAHRRARHQYSDGCPCQSARRLSCAGQGHFSRSDAAIAE